MYEISGVWMLIASVCFFITVASAAPVANGDYYLVTTGTTLQIPAGGVLTNDAPSGLTAVLETDPSHGTVTLTNDGGFTYIPEFGFIGTDTFTYRASDGSVLSSPTPVTITIRPVGAYFYDDFSRATNADASAPWTPVLGQWLIADDMLSGTHTGSEEYEDFYVSMDLSDYRLQGRVQLPQGAWGGGFAGRLNAATGAKYMAVIYPAGSQGSGGLPLMRLIKFHSWDTWNGSYTPMAEVSLPDVGTNWHTERIEFRGTRVMVYLDDVLRIDATDDHVDGLPPLTNGGFVAHMYSENSFYTTHFDDVLVTPLQPVANDDSFTVTTGKSYSSSAPGVLANDLNGVGSLLVPSVVTGPIHGTLVLSTNGSFTYTPTNGYLGGDSFTYQDADGSNTSPPATVSITIVPNFAPDAGDDYFTYAANTTLVVAAPGVLTNDADANGDGFFASLVSWPNHGTLTFDTNGGFAYTPSTNFTGLDQFSYVANDGAVDSSPATVFLKTQPTSLFADNFSVTGTLLPWIVEAGNWDVASGIIDCGPNPFSSYGNIYLTNDWTNFTVSARMRLSEGAFGASLGGRLAPDTGAQYTAWIYPENSPGGSNVLKLIKFSTWTAWGYQGVSYTPMAQADIPPVGTNWHKIKLSFHGNARIAVVFDDVPYISVFDEDSTSLSSGGVSLKTWTDFVQCQDSFDDVIVTPLVNDVTFSTPQNKPLTDNAPGVAANCTPVYATNLTALLLTSPTNGVLSLSTNGSFIYTPDINLRADDTFTCHINDGDTNLGTVRVTITVLPSILTNQTIDFPSIAAKTYGDAPFALLATATSGLPVSYSVLSGPATVTNSTLTITGAGNVNVRAAQSGDLTNHSAAPDVEVAFTVLPAALTVTADDQMRVYGQGNPVLTASYNGFVNGENMAVLSGAPDLVTTATSNTTPGNHAITVGPGTLNASNYNFLFNPGMLSISPAMLTITASADPKIYDGNTQATVKLADNRIAGDAFSITYDTAQFSDKHVGSNKLVSVNGLMISGSAAGNYTFNTNATTTADISVRTLTITPIASDKTYDGTTIVSVTLNDDRVSGDNLTNSFGAAGFVSAQAGTAKSVEVTGILSVGTDAGNYTHNTTASTTANIIPAGLTVTADNASRIYGATNPVFTASFSGFVNSESLAASDVTGEPVLTTLADTNSGVGNYAITCTNGSLASANYSFSFADGALSVMPASLTVAADHKSRLYGTINPVLTATITGFVNDETTSAITGMADLNCAADVTSTVGDYEIVITTGTLTSTNYSFALTNGTLTVGKATLWVTADSTSRIYGVTNPVLTAIINGFVDGDTTNILTGSPELTTSAQTNSPVGSYPITCDIGSLIATNYSFSFAFGSLSVTPAAASITWANPADIVYGVALNSTQLNATGSVEGIFAYTPVAGTILNGGAQLLSVTLTPTDTNYTAAAATVFINVLQAATTNFLTASEYSVAPGDTVTFTSVLSVVAPGAGAPSGQVEFLVDGSSAALSTMTNGVASFSTSSLTHGAHLISARFAGDSEFSGCSNSLATLEIIGRPPVTGIMLLGTKLGLPLTLSVSNLMELASDPDGDAITLTNISPASANGGQISVNSDNITYSPPVNAEGSDSFTYTIADSLGMNTTGRVTIINSQSATVIPPVQILTNGHVVVYFAGAPGYTYTVRASTNLTNWSDIGFVISDANGAVPFEDPDASTLPYRFYRIVPGE